MKIENYREEDIDASIESRRTALHFLESVEMNLWTDDIEGAIQRTQDMHMKLIQLSRMKTRKKIEDLCSELNNIGVKVELLQFEDSERK